MSVFALVWLVSLETRDTSIFMNENSGSWGTGKIPHLAKTEQFTFDFGVPGDRKGETRNSTSARAYLARLEGVLSTISSKMISSSERTFFYPPALQ